MQDEPTVDKASLTLECVGRQTDAGLQPLEMDENSPVLPPVPHLRPARVH